MDHSWRIERYESEIRQGLEPTDDIVKLDTYFQKLRDMSKQLTMEEWEKGTDHWHSITGGIPEIFDYVDESSSLSLRRSDL